MAEPADKENEKQGKKAAEGASRADETAEETAEKTVREAEEEEALPIDVPSDHIIIRAYPKVVFLYPTFLCAFIAGLVVYFFGHGGFLSFEEGKVIGEALTPSEIGIHRAVGFIFMTVFLCNLLTMATEFNRLMTVAFILVIALLITGGILLNQHYEFLAFLKNFFSRISFIANAHFYFGISAVFSFIYLWVLIEIRFDYWEIRSNEVLHHHGFLGDVKRFPAPNLHFEKEIDDVFEFLLLRSGRLILHPHGRARSIILDNVPGINTVEAEIARLLESLSVKVGD